MQKYEEDANKNVEQLLVRKALLMQMKKEQKISTNLGKIATLGGVIIMPILLGIWAGTFMDTHYPVTFSWRLTLIFCGFVWGMINAYFWVKIENEKISATERHVQQQIEQEINKDGSR